MPVSTEKNFEDKLLLLGEWLHSQDKFSGQKLKIKPRESSITTGFSNETFVFNLSSKKMNEDFVLRLKPGGFKVFPNYDLHFQARIMKILRTKGLPTPEILYYEADESIIGSEFYIMNFIEGEAPSDNPPYHTDPEGMMGKASQEQRRSVWLEWLYYMSILHSQKLEDLDLDEFFGDHIGIESLDKELIYYEEFLKWGMEGEENLVCEEALKWLNVNKPKNIQAYKLCWGDCRPGNILYKDFKAKALLDWEMATVGDPVMDLAWGLAVDDSSSLGLEIPKLEGSIENQEAIDIWEKNTGFSTKNYSYYRLFALFKFSVIMVRVAKKLIVNDIMPLDSDFYKNNYVSNYLKREFENIV